MTPERWQKIEQIYHAALERNASLRADYLRQACAGDDSLRREVESLLSQDGHAQFLDAPAAGLAGAILADRQGSSSLIGQQLGSYKILSVLGAGGMGEVYKALDTRLERTVALKVLPAHLASRAESRERFEREAKTIASLNHPHICTLYDTGRQGKIDFLVMEYVEGETLDQRLARGPLPIQQVLQYAVEIADALDKAHRKGIIHRDLKPGNIMLTKSGTKLLDFGLAKLSQSAVPANPESQPPTMQGEITGEGTILGTLQYMAPEQIEARKVDARTDIFAFGAVVYEMTTGKKAFEGKSSASVLAKILEAEPPAMTTLQPMTPPQLDRVVRTCLAKDPDERWQAAGDLRRELKWIAEQKETAQPTTPVPTALPQNVTNKRAWLIALAAVVIVAILAFALIAVMAIIHGPPGPRETAAIATSTPAASRSMLSLPHGQQFNSLNLPVLSLSPNGNYMAYVATSGGVRQIYLHSMDSFDSKPLPGTNGAYDPFFSPDGQWIGFFTDKNLLQRVSINGGTPLNLFGNLGPYGYSWGSNDTIVFGGGGFANSHLFMGPAAGGTAQVLPLELAKNELVLGWPDFLPGDNALLFAASPNPVSWSDAQISIYFLKSRQRRELHLSGMRPRYSPTGHLVFAQGGNLMAVPFDLARMEIAGSALPVIDSVWQFPEFGTAQYSFSENGTLAYIPGAPAPQSRLVWVDRKGDEEVIPAPPRAYLRPRISPEGRRFAVETDESGGQIWTYDLGRDTLTRLTFDGVGNGLAVWTPDGKRITYTSGAPGNLFWQIADGSDKAERLTTWEGRQLGGSWSPDGRALAFVQIDFRSGSQQLWILHVDEHTSQRFIEPSAPHSRETAPKFSPDGRWLAYASNESGGFQIYVRRYPAPGEKWQVSTDGGTEPVWNPKGRELFYRNGDKMMVVEVATRPSFSAGKPRALFSGHYMTAASIPDYDVTPDGQRFLMVKPEQEQPATQINIVQNWFEELKQKVPAAGK